MIRALSNEPVNGRWLLTGLAGRGSSATVYRAFDLVDERLVAIKSLGERGSTARRCRRARREFLDMSSLRHPHLVETYDFAEAGSGPLPQGTPFFTMELLENADLGCGGRVDPRRLARAALGLLAALECVHGHGFVHGDVKPGNVLMDVRGAAPPGCIKLGDLGLARRARAGRGNGTLTGTLHYAAPERIAGGPVDARSDLYSLGVVLYEAATGSLPFDESDPAAALSWHLRSGGGEEDATALPPALSRVIGRLLRTRIEERPHGAREAWEEIAEAAPVALSDEGSFSDPGDGPLVGRFRERACIARWLEARAAAGGFLEIVGPSGSGVSRLAREAAHAGRAAGWSVHAWSCRAGDAPFAPLGRPLREMILRRCGGAFRRHGPTEEEVLALLGGPALWAAPDRLVESAGPPLAAAIAAFLATRAHGRPVLLVLDDADRLDHGTCLVLVELASLPRGASPGLLVVTAAHSGSSGPTGEPAAPPASLCRGVSRAGRRPGRGGAGPESPSREGDAPARTARPAPFARRASLPPIPAHVTGGVPRSHPGSNAPKGAFVHEVLVVEALTEKQAKRLVSTLPGIGALSAREVDAIVRCTERLAGRVARLARSMAGSQLALFPPLSESRRLS